MIDFDVLIIGAGISGVSAAYHLQKKCPDRTFAILEQRENVGGTWDLFRYPGIRSDSDMYTLGFSFKPWKEQKSIADGPSILKYVKETIEETGLEDKIQFGIRVESANWSSIERRWKVKIEDKATGQLRSLTCKFISFCSGYFKYEGGYSPEISGESKFKGQVVHPQLWPPALEYANKKIVIVGSGATAVTLLPVLAKEAAHVTMLQRSPTYMISRPSADGGAVFLQKVLPDQLAYGVIRLRNVLMQIILFFVSRTFPDFMKSRLIDRAKKDLPEGFDVETHLTPSYGPWDQRLCLIPDGDFYESLSNGAASIVTNHIESYTEDGLLLKSGEMLEADIVITATGLELQQFGGAKIFIDGAEKNSGEMTTYKGVMYGGVPNLMQTFGYTNASWTLKADLTSEFMCRVLDNMDETNTDVVMPTVPTDLGHQPFVDFSSGYFARVADKLPKQGDRKPWTLNQNYFVDVFSLRHGGLDDGALVFTAANEASKAANYHNAVAE